MARRGYPHSYPQLCYAVKACPEAVEDDESLEKKAFRKESRTSWDLAESGIGGASRDRTDDLFHAMEALSQLSYSPTFSEGREDTRNLPLAKHGSEGLG